MYQKILVAIDASTSAQQVFDQALELATPLQAQLMLLHVLSSAEEGYPELPLLPPLNYYPGASEPSLAFYHHQWESYEQQGLERLKCFAEQALTAGIRTEITQSSGDPGAIICELGQRWAADLICVGSRGRAGFSELLLGSVSNFVMHHASCSVLVMRSTASRETPADKVPSTTSIKLSRAEPVCSIPLREQERAISHVSGWQ